MLDVPRMFNSGFNPPAGVKLTIPLLTLSVLMALIHALMGVLWFGVLALVAACAGAWLRSPRLQRLFDRVLGVAFVGFGLRLALNR